MADTGIQVVSPAYRDLRDLYRGAREVFVCTPFFSRDGLDELEQSIKKADHVEFWVVLNVTHWMTGHSDFEALRATLNRLHNHVGEIELRVKGNLHSKLYYAQDVRRALLGSANLSNSGFGGNIEIGAILSGSSCAQVDDWIESQRRKLKSIALDDFFACVELSRDAVKAAADKMQDGGVSELDDFNAAVDLFENDLVKKLSDTEERPKPKPKKTRLEPGKPISPAVTNVETSLPKDWPTYKEFLGYLKSRSKNADAAVLLRRANGESNLQGHVKHFYWASLMFFLEHPKLLGKIKSKDILGRPVRWDDVSWAPVWRTFLENHDDEHYPDIDVSFHTIKVYLPPTLGGTTVTGGGGIGNFKRAIVFVADLLREKLS